MKKNKKQKKTAFDLLKLALVFGNAKPCGVHRETDWYCPTCRAHQQLVQATNAAKRFGKRRAEDGRFLTACDHPERPATTSAEADRRCKTLLNDVVTFFDTANTFDVTAVTERGEYRDASTGAVTYFPHVHAHVFVKRSSNRVSAFTGLTKFLQKRCGKRINGRGGYTPSQLRQYVTGRRDFTAFISPDGQRSCRPRKGARLKKCREEFGGQTLTEAIYRMTRYSLKVPTHYKNQWQRYDTELPVEPNELTFVPSVVVVTAKAWGQSVEHVGETVHQFKRVKRIETRRWWESEESWEMTVEDREKGARLGVDSSKQLFAKSAGTDHLAASRASFATILAKVRAHALR